MRKFKLLKDLPHILKGAIYSPANECQYETRDKFFFKGIIKQDTIINYVVENNPEWFAEVKEVKEDKGLEELINMLAKNIKELHKIKNSLRKDNYIEKDKIREALKNSIVGGSVCAYTLGKNIEELITH